MQVEKQPKFYVFFRCSAQLRQFLLAGTEDTKRDTPAGRPFLLRCGIVFTMYYNVKPPKSPWTASGIPLRSCTFKGDIFQATALEKYIVSDACYTGRDGDTG